tara:strand:- start:52 stop:1116 length:1065 start_codon:yes stop_codon:yes gene_type:complete
MATSDDIMDGMISSEKSIVDTGGQKVNLFDSEKGKLVPRVDKYVGTKRAGMREGDLPVFKNEGDARMFLEAAGVVAPPAEMLSGVMMMTEGDLVSGAATIGFGAMGGGSIKAIVKGAVRGSKKAIDTIGTMFRKKPEVIDNIWKSYADDIGKHASQVHSKEELSKRLKDAGKNFDEDHVEGLIKQQNKLDNIENVGYEGDYVRKSSRPAEIRNNKLLGEFRSAAYKAEEYIQRSDYPIAPFMKQSKKYGKGTVEEARDLRGAWLLQKAVDEKVLTGRQADLYRGSAFSEIPYYSESKVIAGKFPTRRHVMEIKDEVRKSLHAEDLNINAAKVEITPKGVRPIGRNQDPFDYLAD